MKNFNPYEGVIPLNDDLTLPYIWSAIHLSAKMASQFSDDKNYGGEVARMKESDLFLLEALREVPSETWARLCNASGWTLYGAIALSWCEDASLQLVGQCIEASGVPITPGAAFDRASSLLNPDLRPDTGSLTKIMEITGNDATAFCVGIAVAKHPLIQDLSEQLRGQAPPEVQTFLTAYLT